MRIVSFQHDVAPRLGEPVQREWVLHAGPGRGGQLAGQFDGLITVDPHLHRIQSLDEVMPGCRSLALSAAPLLGAWVARHVPGALLLGPDEEALQWVAAAGRAEGLDHAPQGAEGHRVHRGAGVRSRGYLR